MTLNKFYHRGETHIAVGEMQRQLNMHAPHPFLEEDNIFGPLTEEALRSYQRWAGLADDGILGPLTWRKLCKDPTDLDLFHPILGPLPVMPDGSNVGRCSSFGGPQDSGDRMYGQAFLINVRRPCDIPEAMPKLTKFGLFNSEALNLTEYPPTTDWRGRKYDHAGLSWALNPNFPFAAMRLPPNWVPDEYRGDNCPTVLVDYSGGMIHCRVTDYGPSIRTGRLIDLSDGALDLLLDGKLDGHKLNTDRRVKVTWAY